MNRLTFVLRRLGQAVPSLIVISILSFLMLRLAPGDPARVVAGPRASAEALAAVRADLGLDQPIWVQYVNYLSRAIHGDFGLNLTGSATVSSLIGSQVVVTAWLTVLAAILTLLICVPLAITAARRPDGIIDGLVRVISVGGLALPSFWVGVMLISYVALPTRVFPVGGWPNGSFADDFRAAFLPALTLAISMAPILVRSLRSSLIDVFNSDYVKAGSAMGVRGNALVRRFVLRNAFVPTIPVVAIVLGFLIGGTVVVESAFNLPGLGQALVQAALTRDSNVVQGLTLVFGTAVILIYLLADIILSLVDPRVKIS